MLIVQKCRSSDGRNFDIRCALVRRFSVFYYVIFCLTLISLYFVSQHRLTRYFEIILN